jgi:RHS repeat-associated protein
VTALLGPNAEGLERYTYDAFGKPKITDWSGNPRVNGGGEPLSAYDNRFMFQGREYIPEMAIYDYRHRMYQPELGRFLQMDPTGFDAGDMNLFRYCDDDPVDGSDPTGLVSQSGAFLRDWWWDFAAKGDSGNASQLTFGDLWNRQNQAPGMDGGDRRGDDRRGRTASGDSEGGKKQQFVKTTGEYKGGYSAIREARNFIQYSHPEMNATKYKYRDWRMASVSKYNGNALIPGNIVIDTKSLTSYREVVSIMYHELIHKAEGPIQAWRNTPAEHHQHVLKADQVGREYFYYPDPPK